MSNKKIENIESSIEKYKEFINICYVNALLHDLDKALTPYINGDNSSDRNHNNPEKRKNDLFPSLKGSLAITKDKQFNIDHPMKKSFPIIEWYQTVKFIVNYACNKPDKKIKDITDQIDLKFLKDDLFKEGFDKKIPVNIFDKIDKETIDKLYDIILKYPELQKEVFYDVVPINSVWNFFLGHHNRENEWEDSTAGLFFHNFFGGIDGEDTGYEIGSENEFNTQQGHHYPDAYVIATPFGYEKKVDNEKNVAKSESSLIEKKLSALLEKTDLSNKDWIKDLRDTITEAAQYALVRKGRPLNDILLSDHLLSCAAMMRCMATKVVVENIVNKEDDLIYAVPLRPCETTISGDGKLLFNTPLSSFSLLSISVNFDYLKKQTLKVVDYFGYKNGIDELFNNIKDYIEFELCVGSEVYKNQYGIHFLIPQLSDRNKRFFSIINNKSIFKELTTEDVITNDEFREFILGKVKGYIEKEIFPNNGEVLIGVRISDLRGNNERNYKLNKLSESIKWTRVNSEYNFIRNQKDEIFFNPIKSEKPLSKSDLCPLCKFAYGRKDIENDDLCDTCFERREAAKKKNQKFSDAEDIKDHKNELVMLTCKLDIEGWLSREKSYGVYIYESNKNIININDIEVEKEKFGMRLNSPGRLRRIWKSSETFWKDIKNELLKDGEKYSTLMVSPTDFQILIPAAKAFEIVNMIYNKYNKEFGRVSLRTPLKVNIIVFKHKFPLYVVFSAVSKMFKKMDDCKDGIYTKICDFDENNFILDKFPTSSTMSFKGDVICEKSFFLEYGIKGNKGLVPKNGEKNIDIFYPFYETKTDSFKHIGSFKSDDIIKIHPSYISYLYMSGGNEFHSFEMDEVFLNSFYKTVVPLKLWETIKEYIEQLKKLPNDQRKYVVTELKRICQMWNDDKLIKKYSESLLKKYNLSSDVDILNGVFFIANNIYDTLK